MTETNLVFLSPSSLFLFYQFRFFLFHFLPIYTNTKLAISLFYLTSSHATTISQLFVSNCLQLLLNFHLFFLTLFIQFSSVNCFLSCSIRASEKLFHFSIQNYCFLPWIIFEQKEKVWLQQKLMSIQEKKHVRKSGNHLLPIGGLEQSNKLQLQIITTVITIIFWSIGTNIFTQVSEVIISNLLLSQGKTDDYVTRSILHLYFDGFVKEIRVNEFYDVERRSK